MRTPTHSHTHSPTATQMKCLFFRQPLQPLSERERRLQRRCKRARAREGDTSSRSSTHSPTATQRKCLCFRQPLQPLSERERRLQRRCKLISQCEFIKLLGTTLSSFKQSVYTTHSPGVEELYENMQLGYITQYLIRNPNNPNKPVCRSSNYGTATH
jgi:hypothetical protein